MTVSHMRGSIFRQIAIFVAIGVLVLIAAIVHARADDARNPAWSEWFRSLSRFEAAAQGYISCCGDGDAVFADDWRVEGREIVATITDNRGHAWAPVGTIVRVPGHMEIADKGNQTGHVVLFLRPYNLTPICIVTGGGV